MRRIIVQPLTLPVYLYLYLFFPILYLFPPYLYLFFPCLYLFPPYLYLFFLYICLCLSLLFRVLRIKLPRRCSRWRLRGGLSGAGRVAP